MVYEYDIDNSTLYLDSVELPLHSQEENVIGTCSDCNSDVMSVSYHVQDEKTVVGAKCNECNTIYAIIYDDQWNWLGEEVISTGSNPRHADVEKSVVTMSVDEPEDSPELIYLRSIPSNKLSAVFSPAEIEAIFSKASGKKYVRQYLYRARKKYQNFNDLFDTTLNI
ncbi:hypothetical protein V7O66_03845 [Methanolobus sp. ZRKC3]|uniref:hypothetical protein n=1 Tax=Methanolobus sp. ZRKC3 TaxID=3125786 RepID=UPI00324A89CA